jgi:tetratricopeptide (TPR) repeat protein
MLRIFFVYLALTVVFLNQSESFGQSAKKLVKEAQEYYEAKNYTQAIQTLNQAIVLDPENGNAFFLLGKTQKSSQNLQEAVLDFNTAAMKMPKNQDVLEELAGVNLELGRYKDAIAVYDKLLVLNSRRSETYTNKAHAQLLTGDFNGASQTTTAALAVNKADDLALYYQAVSFDSLKNTPLAEMTYQKAIDAARSNKFKKDRPTLFKPYFVGLANAQRDLYKADNAIASYTEAVKLDPLDYQSYTSRGKLYVSKLFYQEAMADFNQSIAVNENNAQAFCERALVNKKQGQFQASINDFNQTLILNNQQEKAFEGRGACYEAMGKPEEAVRDYKSALKLSPNNKELNIAYVRAKEKQYEIGKESVAPQLRITSPLGITDQFVIRDDQQTILVEAQITDASPIKSIVFNGQSLALAEDELNPTISATLQVGTMSVFFIEITDIYLNTNKYEFKIVKTEIDPPTVSISKPYETLEHELFIENKPSVYFEGKVRDASKIKSVIVNGTSASFPLDLENPPFQAVVNIGTTDSLVVKVTDVLGNTSSTRYKLVREDTSGANPMGTTWVVFIENSNYKKLQRLEGPGRDVSDMTAALANYKIDKILHKKDLSKAELDKFFSIELRDQIQKNRVKSLVVWYAGHGKFINETGYWIPVDGDTYDEFTYYSVNSLRASLQAYTMLKHVVVVSDACESGPAFYMAMRDDAAPRICDDWEVTKFKSAQVITSSNKELSNDNSLFTQAFANTLSNNPSDCISLESIAFKVSAIVKQNQRQTPKFGKIKGLDDENGTFFFMKKKY